GGHRAGTAIGRFDQRPTIRRADGKLSPVVVAPLWHGHARHTPLRTQQPPRARPDHGRHAIRCTLRRPAQGEPSARGRERISVDILPDHYHRDVSTSPRCPSAATPRPCSPQRQHTVLSFEDGTSMGWASTIVYTVRQW